METSAKLTAKGQVTVPKSVRDALKLEKGDSIVFRVQGDHATIARTPDLLDLAGTIEVPAEVRGMSWSEMVRRTHEGIADDFEP